MFYAKERSSSSIKTWKIGIQLVIPDCAHDLLEIVYVLFPLSRVHKNTINKYDHKDIKVWSEYLAHQIHEGHWCVGQTKRHNEKLVMATPSPKGCIRERLLL